MKMKNKKLLLKTVEEPEWVQKLLDLCKKLGISKSSFIRLAVREYVRKLEKERSENDDKNKS